MANFFFGTFEVVAEGFPFFDRLEGVVVAFIVLLESVPVEGLDFTDEVGADLGGFVFVIRAVFDLEKFEEDGLDGNGVFTFSSDVFFSVFKFEVKFKVGSLLRVR